MVGPFRPLSGRHGELRGVRVHGGGRGVVRLE